LGIGDILITVFTPFPIALLILFIYGLNTSTGVVVYNSIMQSEVSESVRGRIYTLMDVTWNLMRLISLGIGGALVDHIGIQSISYIGGALLIGARILGLLLLGDYRSDSRNNRLSRLRK
jgi:MFS family permease